MIREVSLKTMGMQHGMPHKPKASSLLNECPEVVGIMALTLGNGGSLDTAIRNVADSSLTESSTLFKPVVYDADTRLRPDMRASVNDMLSDLPEEASKYAMAVRMMISASDAKDGAERERLMDESRGISLEGLKEAGKSYSSSLNAPCMAIFSIGIMIPMVLMSVLPMLGLSGLFGSSVVDAGALTAVTLVLIPAAVACVMLSIRSRNPFMSLSRQQLKPTDVMPMAMAIPFYLILTGWGLSEYLAYCIAAAASSLITLACMNRDVLNGRATRKQSELLTEAVFDMGNYLQSGMPFEESFRSSVAPRCPDVGDRFVRRSRLCRGDMESAVRGSVSKVSPRLADIYCEIYRASLKDIRESGRLAITLGRQVMDQDSVRRGIRNDLRGMTETMSGTAAVFAPLVLGLSITILEPLSRISADVDSDGTALVLSVYLTELAALIACTVSFLHGESGIQGIFHRFLTLLPVGLCVFVISASLSFRFRKRHFRKL